MADNQISRGQNEGLDSLSSSELISKLQDVFEEGLGFHSTVNSSAFLPIDEEPSFNVGVLGSQKPSNFAPMAELVRRGAAVLSLLIQHLPDARVTNLVVGESFMGKWFGDEYDPKEKAPHGELKINNRLEGRCFDTYRVKVGDLCFVAIGQIVNREFNAIRYQPTMCLVVNSPIETHALAEAIKRDWEDMTAADHQRCLEQDVFNFPHPKRPAEGLKRLLFYYPEAGRKVLLQMLNRPFLDTRILRTFFERILQPSFDDAGLDNVLAELQQDRNKTNFNGIILGLIWLSFVGQSQDHPDWQQRTKRVNYLLQRLCPGVNSNNPPFIDGTDYGHQTNFINSISGIKSDVIDREISLYFAKLLSQRSEFEEDKREYFALIQVCAVRLASADQMTQLHETYDRFEEICDGDVNEPVSYEQMIRQWQIVLENWRVKSKAE